MDSGWRTWTDERTETMHAELRLTKVDARRLHPDRLELLAQAGRLIEQVFAHPEEPTVGGTMRRIAVEALPEAQRMVEEVLHEVVGPDAPPS